MTRSTPWRMSHEGFLLFSFTRKLRIRRWASRCSGIFYSRFVAAGVIGLLKLLLKNKSAELARNSVIVIWLFVDCRAVSTPQWPRHWFIKRWAIVRPASLSITVY